MNRFAYSASLAFTLTGIITAAVFLFPTVARSQSSEWLVFDTDNSELPDNYIRSLAIDVQDNLWIGTGYGGLSKFDGENWLVYDIGSYDVRALAIDTQGKIWTVVSHHMFSFPCGRLAKFDRASLTLYDTGNSGLRDNDFQVLAIDAQGNKWLGTYKSGLAKFDGANWTVYDTDNSELPDNYVKALVIDTEENKWIGTLFGGLAKFDGEQWTVYDTDNPEVPLYESVEALAIDAQGNIWIVTSPPPWSSIFDRSLTKLDGEQWTVYDTDNSILWDSDASALAVDAQGNVWIGTWRSGLARFDGKNWTVYNTDNSGLPDNDVRALAIDEQGNIWIGTSGGLAVYREGGVILTGVEVEERSSAEVPSAFSLSQNYPNPFNPSTEICFSVPAPSHVKIAIYNVLGQLVRELTDRTYAPGVYRVQWNGTDSANTPVSSGVYLYRMTTNAGAITKRMLLLR